MLILFIEFGCPMQKSAKVPRYPSSYALGERIADLGTKPAVVPEFGETEILGDLLSHRLLDSFGQ
jgi:hypothetical protein